MQLLGGSALVAMALMWPNGPAHAQCVPDPAAAGNNVVCGPNNDTDGFTFTGTGNLGSFTISPGVVVDDSTLVGPSIAVVEIFSAGPNNPGVTGNVTINGSILDIGPSSIGLRVEGPIGGTLLNAGTIIGDQDGINVDRIGGDFTNTAGGVITGGQVGVFSFDITGAFTNAGRITSTGFAGVEVDGNTGVFTNVAGGIITGGETGLLVTGDITGAFTNAGTITGTNSFGVRVEGGTAAFASMAGGTISGAVDGVFVGGDTGVFTNAGMITGGDDGVDVSGSINGTFTNMAGGEITGGFLGDGIFVGGSITGAFTNAGAITGGFFGDGVAVIGDTGAFINMVGGTITGGGDNFSDALDIEGNLDGDFINNGIMSVAGGGTDSEALDILGSLTGNLINNGTMSVTGGGTESDAIDIDGSLDGDFMNTGIISAASSGNDSDGVEVGSIGGSFFNSGLIMGTDSGVAIEAGTIAGGFTNTNIIDGDTDQDGFGAGVEIVSAGGQAATFRNMAGGTIQGAIGFDSEDGDEAVTNAGMIVGREGTSIHLGAGTDSLTLTTGSTLDGTAFGGPGIDAFAITGVVVEDDDILQFETFTFSGDSSGRSILSGIVNTPTNMLTSGTLLANGTLGAAGGTTTVMSGSTLGGTGTVLGATTVQGGGNVAPGAAIGTLTNNGDVAFNSGSMFTIEADGVTNTADLLIVNGGVVIDGATLSFGVGPGGAISPLQATTFIVLANDGVDPITGSGFAAVIPFSPFLTATASTTAGDGNDVALTITADFTVVPGTTLTPNQANVATGLNVLTATPGSDAATVAAALFGLSIADAPNALDRLSGEIHASVANVLLSQGGLIAGTVGNRLAGLRAGEGPIRPVESPLALAALSFDPKEASSAMLLGMAHDNGSLKDEGSKGFVPDDLRYEAWGRAWGRTGTFDDDGNAAETDGEGAGVMAGGDVTLWTGARFGLAAGYSSTRTEADARGSELDADSATILAYLNHVSGAWHAHLIGGYTHHDFDGRRNIIVGVLNRTASSDYDGHQVTVTGEIGYTHEVRGIAVQPIAAVRYGSLTTDSFTETGAGSLNLTSSGDTNQATDTILGVRMSTVWRTSDAIIVPQARIAWTHTFGEVTPDLAMAFAGGGDFTVIGVTRDRDALALGVGLNAVVGEDTTAYIDYAATLSSDQDAHALSGGVRVRF